MKNLSSVLVVICCITFLSCKKDRMANTVTDIDGNVYKTVKIGDQIWMAENLRTHKLNDGTPIAFVTQAATWSDPAISAPMMCYYGNDDVNNKDKYGALYNWYAVNTGKLAPEGWHVATKNDWEKLHIYLVSHGYNYDGTTTGSKVAKSLASTSDWAQDPTVGNVGNDQNSNNKTNFNGFPAGGRSESGDFVSKGEYSIWWTSSVFLPDPNFAYSYSIGSFSPTLNNGQAGVSVGLPIRCVKD